MEDLYFIYDGRNSLDFNIVLEKLPHHSSPERDIEVVPVKGRRSGDLLIDNGAYKNKIIPLEAYVVADTFDEKKEKLKSIKRWLQTNINYKPLIFCDDLNNKYRAACINKLDFEELAETFDKFPIIFNAMPLKEIVNNTITITEKGTIVNNPGATESEPIIRVVGNGDITVTINSQSLVLKDITTFIDVDSEQVNAFKDTVNENHKMFSDFPVLEVGNNTISWTGTVARIEITPRFVEL